MHWTQVGAETHGLETDNAGPICQQAILDAIAAIQWARHKPGKKYAFSMGWAVKEIMADRQWTPAMVLEIGESNHLQPYGLIGITTRFKDTDARSYWFDQGIAVTCLCVEKIERLTVSTPSEVVL